MAPSASVVAVVAAAPAATWTDCRLCGSRLVHNRRVGNRTDDPQKSGLCAECQDRPEAKRFGATGPGPAPATTRPPAGPRGFNAAEKALIKACIKSFMPAKQLLEILNDRLVADQGEKAVPFTMEQLWTEAKGAIDPSQGSDWAGLRKIVAAARRTGLLASITQELVDDFATVFQLSAAQRTHLRDVIRHAQEAR